MSILGFVWWGFPRRQITNYRLVKLCDFLWLATSPFFWLAQMSFNNQESSWGVSRTRTVRIRNAKEGSSLGWSFWLTRNIFCRSCATFTNFFFSYFLLLYLLPPKLDLQNKKYQLISKTKKHQFITKALLLAGSFTILAGGWGWVPTCLYGD